MKKAMREKFREMERKLSEEYGDFNFFGLFLPQESPNRWDLLVAANWLPDDQGEAMSFMIEKMREHLEQEEIFYMSGVAILIVDHPAMDDIYDEVEVQHGLVELRDEVIFGKDIDRAYIITSQRSTAAAH